MCSVQRTEAWTDWRSILHRSRIVLGLILANLIVTGLLQITFNGVLLTPREVMNDECAIRKCKTIAFGYLCKIIKIPLQSIRGDVGLEAGNKSGHGTGSV